MTQFNKFEQLISWSALSPTPQIIYVPQVDDYLCVWDRTVFPLNTVQSVVFANLVITHWPAPGVKQALLQNYREMVIRGVFAGCPFEPTLDSGLCTSASNYFSYATKIITTIMANRKISENYTKQEIVNWFNLDRAQMFNE